MKTPEQIAGEAALNVLNAHDIKLKYANENPIASLAWELGESISYEKGLTELVKHAIGADRKQRDIYELIAEALDERAENGAVEDEAPCRKAAAAARGEGDYQDVIWNMWIGPMLDQLEAVYGE